MKCIFLSSFLLWATAGAGQPGNYERVIANTRVARFVNPLIGTAGEGYTYPGAVSPWGMVSASPHTTYTSRTGYMTGKTIAPAGYYYGEPRINGFGQTHLSGVACPALGAPVIAVNRGRLTPEKYASSYSNEVAKAGYYSVLLDDVKTRVHVTTTPHAACYRFVFRGKDPGYILLDACLNLSWAKHDGYVEKAGKNAWAGWSLTGNTCSQGDRQKVFFYVRSLSPISATGMWRSKKILTDTQQASGKVGAWFACHGSDTVDVAIGISYVSMKNAKENLEKEIGNKDFGTVLQENVARWDSLLSRIRILDNGREKEKEIFYTALYHTLLHPNIVSDVNGEYPLYDAPGTGKDTVHPRYGLFSLWDTYRNLHALLSLFYPQQQQDMLFTLEDMTLSAGHPPRWELYGSEINLMVGDPAVAVLSEGFTKGFHFRQPEKLFETLYKNATDTLNTWRPGNREYLHLGYIPRKTKNVWGSVSTTLEYSYHDWCLAAFARKLGREKEAAVLEKQSKRWRTLYDEQCRIIRPRNKKGEWISPFDPAALKDPTILLSYFLKDHGGPGFVEGNAYQYTFMAPHDIKGLIELSGSVDTFGSHLEYIFENGYFTLWNEPDILYPYLLAADPGRITYMQQQLQQLRSLYFTSSPDGIPGNDDAGTLSAWYVFTALGFYPVNPTGGQYVPGIPLFDHIEIRMPETGALLRITSDPDLQNNHRQKVIFNGKPLKQLSLPHNLLIRGGHLVFTNQDQ